MSSSEELSQYDDKPVKSSQPSSDSEREGSRPVIPRDMFGLYGVHVSNLPSGISQVELEKAFSTVGVVQVCKIMETKCIPLYAFVKYSSTGEAQDALLKFDGYKLNDTVLAVRPAYVSHRWKTKNTPGGKADRRETSSDDGRGRENSKVTTYSMESSDCRLKDGKLSESDVRMFNSKSSKSFSPRKPNGGQVLGPRFQRSSPSRSSASENSLDSHRIQGAPPSQMSTSPSEQTKPVQQNLPVSSSSTSSGQVNGHPVAGSMHSSAFRPYQGKIQEPCGIQNGYAMKNGIATVTSSMHNLGISGENNWNHNHVNSVLDWQQGRAQGVTSYSQGGGTNYQDKSMCSPDGNQYMPAGKWIAQSPCKKNVSSWSTADVVRYFSSSDCAIYAGFFQEQEIDGKALMLLNRDTLLQFMKVGPALKVLQKIEELK